MYVRLNTLKLHPKKQQVVVLYRNFLYKTFSAHQKYYLLCSFPEISEL